LLYYKCYCGEIVARSTYYLTHKSHLNIQIIRTEVIGEYNLELAVQNNKRLVNITNFKSQSIINTQNTIQHDGQKYTDIITALKLLIGSNINFINF